MSVLPTLAVIVWVKPEEAFFIVNVIGLPNVGLALIVIVDALGMVFKANDLDPEQFTDDVYTAA